MKKISTVLLLIVVIFVPNVSFAGDIPEWLLQDEDTQTFIGEVKEMTEESVTLIQRYKAGETVLCGYADENNLYLYKIKKFENGRIELSDDYPMTKRLEDYINNGDFAKAELKRLLNSSDKDTGKHTEQSEPKEETSVKHPDKTDAIGGADGPTSSIVIENTGMVDIWKFVVGIGILLVTAGVLLVKRQKRTR